MSNNVCDRVLNCPCPPSPLMNLSAEASDPPSFFSFEFFDAVVPLGAPDPWFGTTAGGDSCTSVISQQDADDCALRRIENDVWGTWPENGGGGPAIQIFGNHATQCSIDCGEGFEPFVYTLPAGTVIARTQEEADAIAESYCFNRALANKVCVPTPPVFNAVPTAWWKMEELAAADRVDVIGGIHMAQSGVQGTITNGVGRVNKCVNFSNVGGITNVNLNTAILAALSPNGVIGNEVTGWFRVNSADALFRVIYQPFAAAHNLSLLYDKNVTAPNLQVLCQINGVQTFLLIPFTPDAQWHSFSLFVNQATLQFGLQLDNGAVNSTAFAGVFSPSNSRIIVGMSSGVPLGATSVDFDEVALWPRPLTAAERTTLYNSGAGHTWPFTP